MFQKWITLVALLCFTITSYGNNKHEIKYDQYVDSSEYYVKINPDKSLAFMINALEIAQDLGDEEMLAKAYWKSGILYRLKGQLDKSGINLQKAIEYGQGIDFYPLILKEMGITLKQQFRFDEALIYYLESLKIFEEREQLPEIAMMDNNIGRLYFAMGDTDKALFYYKEALAIRSKDSENISYGIVLHNIGAVKEKLGSQDSALYYYRKALNNYQINNDQVLIAYGYASLGNLIEDLDSAHYYLENSYEIRKSLNLEGDLLESLFFIGNLYYKENRTEEAIQTYLSVYEKAVNLNKKQYAYSSAHKLSQLYSTLANYAQAYEYEKKSTEWKELLYTEEKKVKELGFDFRLKQLRQNEKMMELDIDNKSKELKLMISNAQLEKDRRFILQGIVIIALSAVLCIALIIFILVQRRKNRIIAQKSRENELLIKEVHHRVKNNLLSIMSLLRLEKRRLKNSAADKLVVNMENRIVNISLIHETLYNQSDLTAVSLQEYLNTIGENVVGLYQDHIHVELTVSGEASVDADKALYIGQLFSELYTNSCKHAFRNTKDPRIEITIECINDMECRIIYQDNGSGKDPKQTSDSFGFKLIESHTKKIAARKYESNENGYTFTIEFKLK